MDSSGFKSFIGLVKFAFGSEMLKQKFLEILVKANFLVPEFLQQLLEAKVSVLNFVSRI